MNLKNIVPAKEIDSVDPDFTIDLKVAIEEMFKRQTKTYIRVMLVGNAILTASVAAIVIFAK